MKVLVFGNPLVERDSIALKVAEKLKGKYEFRFLDSVEDVENEGRNPVILDSAQGLAETSLLLGLEGLETRRMCSMHDFDIALALKLLKKIGKIDSVKIVAIPAGRSVGKAAREADLILRAISP